MKQPLLLKEFNADEARGEKEMPKILIVDDEEHICQLYSEELKDAGYEAITAESGYRLLERIEDEKPDLVVLDIKLVDYDGLDLLQDIRNRFYDLPVVLCSAYDTYKEDMRSVTADFYVIKSFDLTELKSKIAMALEARLNDGSWSGRESPGLAPKAPLHWTPILPDSKGGRPISF
jgi:two-component system response regulator (stage 0 sporulation protein F)